MKSVLIAIALSITFLSHSQNLISWVSDYRLKVEDFAAPIPANAKESIKGLTNAIIDVNYEQKGDAVQVSVECFFRKSESWIKNNMNQTYVLAHEQGHFDIAEIYARKIRKKLQATKLHKKNGAEQIKKIWDKLYKSYLKEQDKYDKATSHSFKEKQQQEWVNKIAKEIKKLDDYKNSTFLMHFK